MSPESQEDVKKFVLKLIIAKKGDLGRLNHILAFLNQGRELLRSDQNYLIAKLQEEYAITNNSDESLPVRIQRLIQNNIGDRGRLNHILETIQSGKKLYNSDQKYLEAKLGGKISVLLSEKAQTVSLDGSNRSLQIIQDKISIFSHKIASLESILSKNTDNLTSLESTLSKNTNKLGSLEEWIIKKITDFDQKLDGMSKTLGLVREDMELLVKDVSSLQIQIPKIIPMENIEVKSSKNAGRNKCKHCKTILKDRSSFCSIECALAVLNSSDLF